MNSRLSRRAGTILAAALVVSLGVPAHAAEYFGTAGDDKINGSSSADRLIGYGGADKLSGWGGGDYIDGGDGNDILNGNDGQDEIHGGVGGDQEYGGTGADVMNGGANADTMYGGPGQDSLDGGDGADELFGKDVEDVNGTGDLNGDTLRGGEGDDKLYARDGERDDIYCGTGTDTATLDYEDRLMDSSCETVWRGAPASMKDTGKEVAQSARDWALLKEGVKENPLGSDRGPEIDQWAANANISSGVPWCGIFAHEAYLRGGTNLPDYVVSTNSLYSATMRDQDNFSQVKIANLRAGDLVIMDWPGSGDSDDHIAIVLGPYNGSGYIPTISGNYSNAVTKASFPVSQVAVAVRVSL